MLVKLRNGTSHQSGLIDRVTSIINKLATTNNDAVNELVVHCKLGHRIIVHAKAMRDLRLLYPDRDHPAPATKEIIDAMFDLEMNGAQVVSINRVEPQ